MTQRSIPPRPAVDPVAAAARSRYEPLTVHHRRRTAQRQPRRRRPRRRAVRRAQGAAAGAQGAVPARPGHQPGRPRGARRAVRPAGGPPGGRQRPGPPRPGADLQGPRQPGRALRERLPLRRHLAGEPADGLRAAVRRDAGGRRRHDLGQHGRGLRAAARAHQGADRRPAGAAQHRGHLRRRHADREAPRAARAVPRRRAPGGAHPPGDRREGPLRQRVHHALRQLPHPGERALRHRLRARRAASC